MPVSDRRDAGSGEKAVGVGEGVESETSAPTPSPPAETMRIELGLFRQHLINGSHLIRELWQTEVVIRGLLEVASPAGHAAIVDVQDGESVLGKKLIPEPVFPMPLVLGGVHARAAVGIHD